MRLLLDSTIETYRKAEGAFKKVFRETSQNGSSKNTNNTRGDLIMLPAFIRYGSWIGE